jgi:hypothetical protein
MKKWLLALALLLVPSAAFAQCSGVAPANSLCGNLTGAPSVPGFYSAAGAITGSGTINYIPVWTSAATLGNGVYLPLAGGVNLYAAPTATGTGDCLTAPNACQLKTACSFRTQVATYLSGGFNINEAHGTYNSVNADLALCTVKGNSGGSASALTTLLGDCSATTAVILSVPDNDVGVLADDVGEVVVKCQQVNLGNGSIGLQGLQQIILDMDTITWGSCGASAEHLSLGGNAVGNLTGGGENITANCTKHWDFASGTTFNGGALTTLTGTPAFNGAFITAAGDLNINLSAWTTSGTATGTRAILTGLGYMITAAAASCNSVIPGSVACQLSLGFQDNAGDLQTDGKFLNSAMPTPTRAGDIVYNNGSGWWQSVAGCNSGTCYLTENSSGVPTFSQIPTANKTIDIYTQGTIGSITTGKGGFTLWPNAATVDNLAFSSNIFTCSVNPVITMYECGTSTTCNAPTTIGAVTITAAHTVVSFTSLSSTAIAAGDYTAWDLTGTCTALNPIGKAMVHFN